MGAGKSEEELVLHGRVLLFQISCRVTRYPLKRTETRMYIYLHVAKCRRVNAAVHPEIRVIR